jgi:hypothetical protein
MISAVADYSGTFVQGTRGSLLLRITDLDGTPQDPEEISLNIKFTDSGTLVDSGTPEKVETGFYVFEWFVPNDLQPGRYTVSWVYTVEEEGSDEIKLATQEIIVATDAEDTVLWSGRVLDMRKALERHIYCAQNIPVYQEQAKLSGDNTTYRFTFPRWNQTSGIKIFRNGNIVSSDLTVNYFKGEVLFESNLTNYDVITANYNFRWFDDEALNQFLENGVNTLNSYPPMSPQFNLLNVPDRWVPGVLYKAAADALRQLMLCLQFQEPQQVFGGSDAASKAFSNIESLKKNYEEDWKTAFENKKFGPYPKMGAAVIPSYTLPGGRSRWFRYLFK